jgi:hypothetical protein
MKYFREQNDYGTHRKKEQRTWNEEDVKNLEEFSGKNETT